jgi:hypothetical protein
MSMEIHVFFRGRLPTKTALSRAMKELGFPFSIKPATGSLEQQSGFMPMLMRREETGVEFDVWNDHSAVEEFADVGVAQSFEHVASFRWGGDFQEAVAGMCAATALAKLVNGVVFDEAEDKLLSVDDAIALARKSVSELPEPPRHRRPRGPTMLKRILAPLLAKRSDLVLAPSLLLVRPVRHLMRGGEFEWTDHGTKCTVRPFIRPLYQPSPIFLNDAVFDESVENPDFEAMLFDRLAIEVFEPLGHISTIEDLIESKWGKQLWSKQLFCSILLSRGLEEGKAIAATIEEADKRDLEKCRARLAAANRKDGLEQRYLRAELKLAEKSMEGSKVRSALLARGEAALFEHYRTWEAAVARGHKIEHAWEPSPFPAQLPASEREVKSADPRFTPTPWLEFPATWRQDPPEMPGETRFAIHWWYRQERLELLHPITREQAEARHRNFETYVLAVRLPTGQALILSRIASPMKDLPLVTYVLWIYDSQGERMIVAFKEKFDTRGNLEMESVNIKGERNWYSNLNFEQGEKTIHEYRLGEKSYECRPMTDEDRSLYVFRQPGFGEIDDLWRRISIYLTNEGFGVFA